VYGRLAVQARIASRRILAWLRILLRLLLIVIGDLFTTRSTLNPAY
jgi:hypothetical protein